MGGLRESTEQWIVAFSSPSDLISLLVAAYDWAKGEAETRSGPLNNISRKQGKITYLFIYFHVAHMSNTLFFDWIIKLMIVVGRRPF